MKIGYSPSGFYPRELPAKDATAKLLDLAETAHELGYDYIEKGDHHIVDSGQYLQNVPTSGRLAALFDHIATMFLLPMYDPVLVAEQAGTLCAMVERFDFWCALGYNEDAFRAFGVPKRQRAPRFEEQLALIRRLWSEDEVTFEGAYYRVEDVSVNPKADARICIGGSAEPAVRRAGRLGDAWVSSSADHDTLEEKIQWFEEAGGGAVIVRLDAVGLPNDADAKEHARSLIKDGYRGWSSDANYLAGDAIHLAEYLGELVDSGVDEVVVRPMDRTYATETLTELAEAKEQC